MISKLDFSDNLLGAVVKMTDFNESELEENEILIPFADMIQQLVDYGETLFLLSNE